MIPPETVARRAEIVRETRKFFDGRGFVEVDTPCRIGAPAPEPHIDCPPVATGGFLRASPELQMKKLLASGLERIYQIGPCFRDGERGSRHNPEFTMIEWYRKCATSRDIMDETSALVSLLSGKFCGGRRFARRGIATVRDMYLKHAGWDPWSDWDADRFDIDMAEKIEPAIARTGGMVYLYGYPPQAASLARVENGIADRWELYVDGMELANCFGELCDPAEQAARFAAAKETRRRLGEADYPLDGEFLEKIGRIGGAAGIALGIDRLVMLLLDLPSIDQARIQP